MTKPQRALLMAVCTPYLALKVMQSVDSRRANSVTYTIKRVSPVGLTFLVAEAQNDSLMRL